MSNKNIVYIWRIPADFPINHILEYRWKERRTDSSIFMDGKRLPVEATRSIQTENNMEHPDYDLVFNSNLTEEKLLKYDCIPNSLGGRPPIVNSKVLEFLKLECPDDFQDFTIEINGFDKSGKCYSNKGYHLLNIVNCVDSIDKENSICQCYPNGEVDILKKLVLKKNALGKHHMARLDMYTPLLLVSDNIVSIFKAEKIKGVSFLTDSEAFPYTPTEEVIIGLFKANPEAAKRYFVSQLNTKEDYEFLKTRVHKVPQEILEALIEMTLSRSSFHAAQCTELLGLLEKGK